MIPITRPAVATPDLAPATLAFLPPTTESTRPTIARGRATREVKPNQARRMARTSLGRTKSVDYATLVGVAWVQIPLLRPKNDCNFDTIPRTNPVIDKPLPILTSINNFSRLRIYHYTQYIDS